MRLFQRSTRKLSLTEPGQQYLEALTRFLPELEEVEATIASQRVEATGLQLNAPLSFGVRYIAPLVPAFAKKHPNVTVDLGLNDRVVNPDGRGMGFDDPGWPAQGQPPRITQACRARWLFAQPPTPVGQAGQPRGTAELSNHNCMGSSISNIARPDEWSFGRNQDNPGSVKGEHASQQWRCPGGCRRRRAGVLYEPEFIVAGCHSPRRPRAVSLDIPTADLGGIHIDLLARPCSAGEGSGHDRLPRRGVRPQAAVGASLEPIPVDLCSA